MVDKLFKDVVPDYADYLNRQTGKYFSHEKDNTHWERGQQRYIAGQLPRPKGRGLQLKF